LKIQSSSKIQSTYIEKVNQHNNFYIKHNPKNQFMNKFLRSNQHPNTKTHLINSKLKTKRFKNLQHESFKVDEH